MDIEDLKHKNIERCSRYTLKHNYLTIPNSNPSEERDMVRLTLALNRMKYFYAGSTVVDLIDKKTGKMINANYAVVKIEETFSNKKDIELYERSLSKYEKDYMRENKDGTVTVKTYVQVPLYVEGNPPSAINIDPGLFLIAKYKKLVKYSNKYLTSHMTDENGNDFNGYSYPYLGDNYSVFSSVATNSLSESAERDVEKQIRELAGSDVQTM